MPTSSAETAAALEVERLDAGYTPGAPVVREIGLAVRPGQIVAIVGPNGAGKSTLLKAITGQISVFKGTVRLAGEDVTRLRGDQLARRGLGYVPQSRDVFPTLSVMENLQMGGYLLPRRKVPSRIEEVLRGFPALAALKTRTAGRLSGGERKMLAICRVLMLRPSLLILDEPTASLAPALARRVLEEQVPAIARLGVGVLLVEQHAAEALAVADWAHVLIAGCVRTGAKAADLLARDDFGRLLFGR